MAKFRKKPVVIEAEQWLGDPERLAPGAIDFDPVFGHAFIETLEGKMAVSPGDWIITGVRGEIYVCRDEIFRATYEIVVPSDRFSECPACVLNRSPHPVANEKGEPYEAGQHAMHYLLGVYACSELGVGDVRDWLCEKHRMAFDGYGESLREKKARRRMRVPTRNVFTRAELFAGVLCEAPGCDRHPVFMAEYDGPYGIVFCEEHKHLATNQPEKT